MIGLNTCLLFSLALFAIGAVGLLARRNFFIALIGLEMMLNAVNISFVAYARYQPAVDGQVFSLFVMAVAAAEAAVGLALALLLYRQKRSVRTEDFRELKE